ncbi:hypothetical protein ACT4US_21120, partial [Bacillus sp. HC-Mk]
MRPTHLGLARATTSPPFLQAEDLTAAEWMFDMVKTIAPSARKPNFAGWANDIRLMRERDGRNHRDMCVLFRWACQDNFWSGNVLSPAKLRDKWTQLEINRNKQQAGMIASKPKLGFLADGAMVFTMSNIHSAAVRSS